MKKVHQSADQHVSSGLFLRSAAFLCLCAIAFLANAKVSAQTLTAKELAARVDSHYNHLKSLQTHFVEQYEGMGIQRTESGTLLLKKPGRMRWNYDEPAGKLFLLDGHSAYSYTPGDAQAQRVPAKQLDDLRSPLRFLLGHTKLEKELTGLTLTPIADGFRLSGVPVGMEQRVRSLSLDVTAEGIIQAMRMEEIDGATTDFRFSDIKENLPTRDSDFVFTPPAGVGVVEGLPPM
ncbi:MAG: LolA family protein [Acidobacteriaceae bacterium]